MAHHFSSCATSVVNVAPTQVDSGRFRSLQHCWTLWQRICRWSHHTPNLGDVGRIGVQSPRGADADDCSSASSKSCWVGIEVIEWCVLPFGQTGDSVGHREVNCVRENEAMGIVVDPTFVEFRDSQPVRTTTVNSDGPMPHQSTIPIGVTECDDQSVCDEVDDESSDTESVDSRNGMSDSRVQCQVWRQLIP